MFYKAGFAFAIALTMNRQLVHETVPRSTMKFVIVVMFVLVRKEFVSKYVGMVFRFNTIVMMVISEIMMGARISVGLIRVLFVRRLVISRRFVGLMLLWRLRMLLLRRLMGLIS